MSSTREVCHCGHDIDTHFERTHSCLGMGCDDCDRYRDENRPDPKKAPKLVHPDRWRDSFWLGGKFFPGKWEECGCYECDRARKAGAR